MNDSNKINLQDINKQEKTKNKIKFSIPFKKIDEPKRDDLGKFTTGSNTLKFAKKLNWKRAIPVLLVFTVVGGFFVLQSFAGVRRAQAYEYQAKSCNARARNYADCINRSTEALVYRLYFASRGTEPEVAYHQRMSISIMKYQRAIACEIVGSMECRNFTTGVSPQPSKYLTKEQQKQFISTLYKNIFNRRPSDKEYTALGLGSVQTKTTIALKFVNYQNVIDKMQPKVVSYIKKGLKGGANNPEPVARPLNCPVKPEMIKRSSNNDLTTTWRTYYWNETKGTCSFKDEVAR